VGFCEATDGEVARLHFRCPPFCHFQLEWTPYDWNHPSLVPPQALTAPPPPHPGEQAERRPCLPAESRVRRLAVRSPRPLEALRGWRCWHSARRMRQQGQTELSPLRGMKKGRQTWRRSAAGVVALVSIRSGLKARDPQAQRGAAHRDLCELAAVGAGRGRRDSRGRLSLLGGGRSGRRWRDGRHGDGASRNPCQVMA